MPVAGHPGEFVPVEWVGAGAGADAEGNKGKKGKSKWVQVSREQARIRASAMSSLARRMTRQLARDSGEIQQLSARVTTLGRMNRHLKGVYEEVQEMDPRDGPRGPQGDSGVNGKPGPVGYQGPRGKSGTYGERLGRGEVAGKLKIDCRLLAVIGQGLVWGGLGGVIADFPRGSAYRVVVSGPRPSRPFRCSVVGPPPHLVKFLLFFSGPKGPRGIPAAPGPRGLPGADGLPGLEGPRGRRGAPSCPGSLCEAGGDNKSPQIPAREAHASAQL